MVCSPRPVCKSGATILLKGEGMHEKTQPFGAVLHAATGEVEPVGPRTERRLSDPEGLYADPEAWRAVVEDGDPLVYTVVAAPVPEEAGQVPFSITTIELGRVGDEFFMTKGHWHTAEEGEVYVGMEGTGVLLLFDGEEARPVDLAPGLAGYIPPGWAHRTVNTSDEPFRFLAVYPGAAGHDYEMVLRHGMGADVMQDAGGYTLCPAASGEESRA